MRYFAILFGMVVGLGAAVGGYSHLGALAQQPPAKPADAAKPAERPAAGKAPGKPTNKDLPPPAYGSPLTIKEAITAADAARREAEGKGKDVSIAVVDSAGRLVAFYRMDGAHYASGDLARAKALTAVEFKTSTAKIQEVLLNDRAGIRLLRVDATPVSGGQLILRKRSPDRDVIAGAIGVAGADDEDDGIATMGAAVVVK